MKYENNKPEATEKAFDRWLVLVTKPLNGYYLKLWRGYVYRLQGEIKPEGMFHQDMHLGFCSVSKIVCICEEAIISYW